MTNLEGDCSKVTGLGVNALMTGSGRRSGGGGGGGEVGSKNPPISVVPAKRENLG